MQTLFSKAQLQTLCDAAAQAAYAAGRLIESVDRTRLQRVFKDSGSNEASQLVTEVDIRSEDIIRQHLEKESESSAIAFVGEESFLRSSANAQERFDKPYFWCVDPLDGTLPFAQGRSGYSVSIALVERSGKPVIGIVYDPSLDVLYRSIEGHGSYLNNTPLSQSAHPSESLVVYADTSFKAHTKYDSTVIALEKCAQTLQLNGLTFVYGDGAVKNACQVIQSIQACYLKLPKREDGGGSIWDYAATACIAQEAGAWASDVHGESLALNSRGSTFMNHNGVLFASNANIAQCLLGALRQLDDHSLET